MEKPLMNINELAEYLCTSRATILRHRCGQINAPLLAGLPEAIQPRPLLWLKADIDAWLESKRTFKSQAHDVGNDAMERTQVKRGRKPLRVPDPF